MPRPHFLQGSECSCDTSGSAGLQCASHEHVEAHLACKLPQPIVLIVLVCCYLSACGRMDIAVRVWHRASQTPILSPQGDGWESAGTFNPAVVMHDGKIRHALPCPGSHGTSRLGYAESADGIHFTRRPEPVLSPEAEYEKDGGVEDPRLVQVR